MLEAEGAGTHLELVPGCCVVLVHGSLLQGLTDRLTTDTITHMPTQRKTENRTEVIHVRLELATLDALRGRAAADSRSLSNYAAKILTDHLTNQKGAE